MTSTTPGPDGGPPPLAAASSPLAAAVTAAAAAWPLVTVSHHADGVVLRAAGRPFATVTAAGVELRLPPRVRDMLVETGRAATLPHPRRALLPAGPRDAVDLDLVRLAYERARIAAGP